MKAFREQIQRLFFSLTLRQRIIAGVAAVLVVAGLFGFRLWQKERNFKPLFQNLSGEDAGLILTRLKESGVEVRLEEGGKTIKVPADKVDELRIQMASSGIPKSGRIGFELFDKANFGISEFTEQVNYHRAVEGELERSVMTMQEVESARVHITFPRKTLFIESRQPAKASVLLKFKPGAKMARAGLLAVAHLTASAVEGLTPDQVSVLDMRGNLLLKPQEESAADEETSQRVLEFQGRMEKELLQKLQATLEPLLGPDRFRAAVSIDCDMTSGDQSEETFDPERSVMLQSQRSEDGSAASSANGVPGTPSNLPRPTSRPGTNGSGPLFRRSENTTFQTSRVVRHIKLPQGQIRRMSVSVLLDHAVRMDGAKRIVEAPAPERLRAIREIVAGTVGFQENRGDRIVVEALPFETTRPADSPPAAAVSGGVQFPRPQLPLWIPDYIRVPLEGHLSWLLAQSWLPPVVIAIALAILYGFFRILKAAGAKTVSLAKRLKPAPKTKGVKVDVTVTDAIEGAPAPQGQIEAGPQTAGLDASIIPLDTKLKQRAEEQERVTLEALNQLELPKVEVHKTEVLTRHIHEMVKTDPVSVANLLRTWLSEHGR